VLDEPEVNMNRITSRWIALMLVACGHEDATVRSDAPHGDGAQVDAATGDAANADAPSDANTRVMIDINGDGFADVLVGADVAAKVSVYFGSATIDATSWNGTTPALRIDVTSPDTSGANFGSALSSAGDVNGDGYADFLVGALDDSGSMGAAHLYLGSAAPTATDWNGPSAARRIDLTGPDGANARFGKAVAGAGDINADGYADFVVGAYTGGMHGMAHVYFGSANPTATDWNATSTATRVDLASPDDNGALYGGSVTGAGDVNLDGYADFIVGDYGATASGAAYVYLGAAAPGSAAWNGAAATLRIDVVGVNDSIAVSSAGVGDVNGDGYSDFLLGSSRPAGDARLYLGSATVSAATWNGTTATRRVDLVSPDSATAYFGSEVSSAGDVNGDGYADFIVTGQNENASAGIAHLYLGSATASTVDWNGASAARRIDIPGADGTNAYFGAAAAGAGDVNHDGYADFVIGAYGAASLTGAAHLYLGSASAAAIDWNGRAPAKRVDLTDPHGVSAFFGVAVAGVP
jgi:hypothetical protein